MEWFWICLRWVFWIVAILVMMPVLFLCRIDQRVDYAEDLAFGYDDDDLGEDVDE